MIYHLTTPADWEKSLTEDFHEADSLSQEGFIHCSTKEQILPTAQLHFTDGETLVVLGIVEKRVKSILKWEHSRNGELFPHIYGKIPLSAIDTTFMLLRTKEGKWEWVE